MKRQGKIETVLFSSLLGQHILYKQRETNLFNKKQVKRE
jgi:hypothetical protein